MTLYPKTNALTKDNPLYRPLSHPPSQAMTVMPVRQRNKSYVGVVQVYFRQLNHFFQGRWNEVEQVGMEKRLKVPWWPSFASLLLDDRFCTRLHKDGKCQKTHSVKKKFIFFVYTFRGSDCEMQCGRGAVVMFFKVANEALKNKQIFITDEEKQRSPTTKTAFVSAPICRDCLTNLLGVDKEV